ncbi:GntR family transcriptional regulator [soil metagenome]
MRVADELRRRILNGEFAPEQRLKIDDLAALLMVSQMPVRAALHELEAEGILDVFPHRGAVIRAVDTRFIENMFDLRAAVEGMLTERCAAHIDDAGIATLKSLAKDYERAAELKDSAAMVASNLKLHAAINRVADNPEAVRVLSRGRLLVQALRVRFGFGFGRSDAIAREHAMLIDAIAAKDVRRAGELAREHCVGARDDLLALLAEQRPDRITTT